jgi:hypothetical protein
MVMPLVFIRCCTMSLASQPNQSDLDRFVAAQDRLLSGALPPRHRGEHSGEQFGPASGWQ